MSKKVWETAGGVCSILSSSICGGFAVTDRINGQSIWVVWVLMTFAVVINGIAMIRHAQKRVGGTSSAQRVQGVARVRP
jgi:hypothetical protein